MYIKVRNKSDVLHLVTLISRGSSYGLKETRDFGSSQVKQELEMEKSRPERVADGSDLERLLSFLER